MAVNLNRRCRNAALLITIAPVLVYALIAFALA